MRPSSRGAKTLPGTDGSEYNIFIIACVSGEGFEFVGLKPYYGGSMPLNIYMYSKGLCHNQWPGNNRQTGQEKVEQLKGQVQGTNYIFAFKM